MVTLALSGHMQSRAVTAPVLWVRPRTRTHEQGAEPANLHGRLLRVGSDVRLSGHFLLLLSFPPTVLKCKILTSLG